MIERAIEAGDRHFYLVGLRKGQFIDLIVAQDGIDVQARLTDPEGDVVLEVDGPNGDQGLEAMPVVAESTGEYRLEILARDGQTPGFYSLRVEALRSATQHDRSRSEAAQVLQRGEQLARQSDPPTLQQALQVFGKAARLMQASGDSRGEALAMRLIGRVHRKLGHQERELTAYRRGIAAALKGGAEREAALLLHQVGRWEQKAGQHDAASIAFRQAHDLFAKLGDKLRQGRLLNRIATSEHYAGRSQEAIRVYRQALTIFKDLGETTMEAVIRNNLGEAYLSLAQTELALDQLLPLSELHRSLGNVEGEAVTLISIGRIHRRRGEFEAARASFREALGLLRSQSEEVGSRTRKREAIALGDLGQAEFKLGKIKRALAAYREALAIAHELNDGALEGITRVNLAWLQEESGALSDALQHYRVALPLLEQHGNRHGIASASIGVARTERKRGDLRSAVEWAGRAVAEVEALRGNSETPSLQSSYFASKRHYYDFLIDLLMELDRQEPEAGHSAEAFRVSERSRARSLLSSLVESRADLHRELPPELLVRERELRDRIRALDLKRIQGQRGESSQSGDRELRSAVAEYRDVRGLIRGRGRDLTDLPEIPVLELGAIQREILDRETLLLEYSLGEARSYLWLVSNSYFHAYVLPGEERIEALARRAHQLLTQSHLKGVEQQTELVLAELSEMLLGPVRERLKDQRLVIVADGVLHYIPFATLRARRHSADTRPLIVDHEIISLPSIAVLEALRQPSVRREPASGIMAVVADPVFSPYDSRIQNSVTTAVLEGSKVRSQLEVYDRLPAAGEEARAIAELVDASRSLFSVGVEANLDLVRSGVLAEYRFLHLATHGRLDTDYPELSGVVLSLVDEKGRPREGILYAHEIQDLRLPTELVVLSSCDTALGQEVGGEGLINLTRSVLHGGASRVMVSLWSVEDRATAALMRRFYDGLLGQNLPPATALRAAQVSMLSEPRWRAPYYWAGFTLQGDWR